MRAIRRTDHAPRVEMLPLIDVIFLLLTFFIYSLVLMVQAQILPVELSPLSSGQSAKPADIQAITVDREGLIYLNRQPIAVDAIDAKLAELASLDPQPTLYLALESQGDVDRGPLLLNLIEMVRGAGLERFVLVGQE